jgi:hypothetical protein
MGRRVLPSRTLQAWAAAVQRVQAAEGGADRHWGCSLQRRALLHWQRTASQQVCAAAGQSVWCRPRV